MGALRIRLRPYFRAVNGKSHFAGSMNIPRTLTVVDEMNVIVTASEGSQSRFLID